MYPNVPDGYALVRSQIDTPGGTGHAMCIWGIKVETPPSDANELAADAHTAFGHLAVNMASDHKLFQTTVVWNHGGVLEEGVQIGDVVGTSEPPGAPAQVSVLIRKQSSTIGRHGRGRFYLPGQATVGITSDGATIDDTALTNWQDAANNWFTTSVSDGRIPVLLHRDVSVLPTVITAPLAEQTLATQRRRLRRAAHR